MVMDRVCRDEAVVRAIERMWMKQFVSSVAVPTNLDLYCLFIQTRSVNTINYVLNSAA